MQNIFSEVALLLILICLLIMSVYEFTVVKIRCGNNDDDSNHYYYYINGKHPVSVLFFSPVFPNHFYEICTDQKTSNFIAALAKL